MKAVIYARYSSDSQREESIEGQIRECTAFAEKNGITILRHYIDRAYSAKTDNRPDFQEMIKDSGKKLFDMVIVWKLDRFARNRYDSARYKAQLKRNGVKVVSATEVISEGAEGIILESVLEGYAEYYSADLSEKVIRGRKENALKCKFNGGTLPIGYVIDEEQHFQIDPLTAPFVLDVFKKYDKGATMKELWDWLNDSGVRNTRGQPLNFNSIQHMLSNRRYIGEYKYRDIIIPDGIPAIVPEDLFDRVQEKLAQNRKAPARHKAEDDYLLTTKLFCGYCGAYLCGESGKSRNGTIHHYYKCVSVKKKRTDCKKKPVRKQWLEDLVVNEVMKVVMDDKAIEAIVSMVMDLQDRENTSLPLYEQQLREAETGIQNLLNAIQQGILTKSTKSRLEELEAAKEELEIKIANEKIAKPRISPEFVTFWLHKFRKLDVRQQSHRKMLIDTFTFNYKDGTRTITLDDVKEAVKNNTGSDLDCRGAPKGGAAVSCPAFWCRWQWMRIQWFDKRASKSLIWLTRTYAASVASRSPTFKYARWPPIWAAMLYLSLSRQSRWTGVADRSAVGKIQLLCRQRHLGHGKHAVMRIDIPGVFQRVEIHAVPELAEILILDMAGIQARHRLDHFKGVTVHVCSPHGKAVHVVHHCPLSETDKPFCIRQRIDRHGQYTAGIDSLLDLAADVLALPFIPVGNVGKLRLALVGRQLAEFRHGPAFTARLTAQRRPGRAHVKLLSAARALIEHLVQPLRPSLIRRADPTLLLPGEIVVLKRLDDPAVNFVCRCRSQLFRREEQREVRLRRLDAAVVQIPER